MPTLILKHVLTLSPVCLLLLRAARPTSTPCSSTTLPFAGTAAHDKKPSSRSRTASGSARNSTRPPPTRTRTTSPIPSSRHSRTTRDSSSPPCRSPRRALRRFGRILLPSAVCFASCFFCSALCFPFSCSALLALLSLATRSVYVSTTSHLLYVRSFSRTLLHLARNHVFASPLIASLLLHLALHLALLYIIRNLTTFLLSVSTRLVSTPIQFPHSRTYSFIDLDTTALHFTLPRSESKRQCILSKEIEITKDRLLWARFFCVGRVAMRVKSS